MDNTYKKLDYRKKLFAPLRNDKSTFFWSVVRAIFWGLMGPFMALSMKNMISALQCHDIDGFLWAVVFVAVYMILVVFPNHLFRKNNERFFRGLQTQFYDTYIVKYLYLENNIADSQGTGFFNNVIQKGGDNWSSILSSITKDGLTVLITIVSAVFLVAFSVGWLGFLIVFFFFGASFFVSQYGNRKMVPLRKSMREYFTQADRDIVRLLMSKFEVIQNQQTSYELTKLGGYFDEITARKYKESFIQILTFDSQRGGVYLLQIFLVLYVGYGVYNGQYEIGLLSLVWMLSNQINKGLGDLVQYVGDFYTRIIYVEKLRETFDDAPQIRGYDTGTEFIYKRGDIVLDNITYDYGKGEVLKNFSLTIQGGKKTALVGMSGSGKSTLIKLIAGYIHPLSGAILIDNQELPTSQNDDFVSLQSYYHHIGYLTQEPNVFDGTIYENLTYALDEIGHATSVSLQSQIKKIIKLAQCEFIYDFPEGLQTHIGEKGIKLSGGQRQRLAIAKIMLKNPQIILLDEPTSALDSFSEEEVTKALENLFEGKTVIIIAHRLQTVKKADEIVVLDSGKVVEKGSHQQLVKHGGQYAKMLELQSGF